MTNDNDARGALTDEQLGRFLLPLMRKHLSPVAIDHLTLGDDPTIGMRKLTRALLTEARSDGFRDCIDAIRGAIEFGKQDVNHAPTEHWLAEFWDIGRKLAAPSLPAGDGLTDRALHADIMNLQCVVPDHLEDDAAVKMAYRNGHRDARHAAAELAAAQQVQADAGMVATPIPGRQPLHYTGGCFIRYVELPDGVKLEHVEGDTWRIVVASPSPAGESDKRDAERYRWLRDTYRLCWHAQCLPPSFGFARVIGPGTLDIEIDRAIAAMSREQSGDQ